MELLEKLVNQTELLDNQLVLGLSGAAKSYVISKIKERHNVPILYVTYNLLQATYVYQDLLTLLPNESVYLFPVEETIAAEYATASKDLVSQRVEVLDFLTKQKSGVVVLPLSALRHRLSPKTLFKESVLSISVGEEWHLDAIIKILHTMGYIREKLVESPGQFSVRGGILDIFPLTHDQPLRLEFFDTEIDSIRQFDAETQKSIEVLDNVTILPASDILFDEEVLENAVSTIGKSKQKAIKKITDETLADSIHVFFDGLVQRIEHHELPEHPALYMDLIYPNISILDYLDEKGLVVLDEYARLIEQEKTSLSEEQDWLLHKVEQAVLLPTQELKLDFKEIIKKDTHKKLYFSNLQKGLGRIAFSEIYSFQYRSMPQFFSQMPLIKNEMERFTKQQMTVVVCVSDMKRAEKVSQTFSDFDIQNVVTTLSDLQLSAINIVVGSIHSGFELPIEKIVFLNERELFNKVTKTIAKRQNLTNAERLKSYSELTAGDFVVHVSHGVGKYQGMETLDIGGVKQDYMSIIYQDDAKLFIPVTQIHLVQKYVASDGKDPKVNKLGGTEWAKTKKKVARKIEDIADELIELYAKRESEVGFAFSKDSKEQHDFEEAFPYAETPDQLRSVKEIKHDMEKAKPMDRLLVGDVGYGKTEVAMRAIFKAVQDGKQVAFLVPTTVLAQQHYMTLVQRFEDYPITIGLLSRFRTKMQQEETVSGIKKGTVDIVVGTHRLVSKDVDFSDLGLLVIDEEQRFGVRHKERLKQLKSQVDVLTLTATPIPRTLHMSMLGVRDLSVIETPPANRYPVQTYVMEQDDALVRDAIERELARNGQVFYLYNRVESIQEKAEHIRMLVPDARIAIAHGQLSEVDLENTLLSFMQGEYDVLVTTTIIETGVDLPNVNTLFIEDADRMGLSQLYQLRGRVGRTNRIAYAYFMYQPHKMLTETSEKRLEAIKEFTQLGAGFKIAMRDLSIRGAGNLLGQQQSGFIDSVGFDLFTEMLKEAVEVKRTGKAKVVKNVEIDLGITAYIPTNYVEDERQKIDLYKRIRTIDSLEDYRQIQDDLIDRFGDYPQEVSDLVNIGLLKYYAEKQDVDKIKRVGNKVFVTYSKEKSRMLSAPTLFEQLGKVTLKAQINQDNQQLSVVFDITGLEIYLWLEILQKYLEI
ncbi:transcription-repair coupling factor [Carnobacteriaceae bacterium zg-ZUI78]|uniref:transcription-repair coupling factor n=1 Tax=Granulicatella sp. zg-84 TaxID=2678503 RepID=UPI0013C2053D|nr:transcription-repair coupling factor [Granulicatella sp. zg-84]MBS4750883.1 transcription-repair coupling factor [Carnobacteriaceae bacterium zg-ZUI78]NEW65550.1 transcription-repair coupling factor [Granulicatella sp. zg-84]QMI85568.1 transcription-repair coupling factor [Carnobacteriaceae bacterium zg-84]